MRVGVKHKHTNQQQAAVTVQEAVKNCQYWRLRDENNKPPGVIGYWPERSVTFIDNHDTGARPLACHIP